MIKTREKRTFWALAVPLTYITQPFLPTYFTNFDVVDPGIAMIEQPPPVHRVRLKCRTRKCCHHGHCGCSHGPNRTYIVTGNPLVKRPTRQTASMNQYIKKLQDYAAWSFLLNALAQQNARHKTPYHPSSHNQPPSQDYQHFTTPQQHVSQHTPYTTDPTTQPTAANPLQPSTLRKPYLSTSEPPSSPAHRPDAATQGHAALPQQAHWVSPKKTPVTVRPTSHEIINDAQRQKNLLPFSRRPLREPVDSSTAPATVVPSNVAKDAFPLPSYTLTSSRPPQRSKKDPYSARQFVPTVEELQEASRNLKPTGISLWNMKTYFTPPDQQCSISFTSPLAERTSAVKKNLGVAYNVF